MIKNTVWLSILFTLHIESQFHVVQSQDVQKRVVQRQGRPTRQAFLWTTPRPKGFLDEGPFRDETYDPTIGYEPYWAEGGWVINTGAWGKKADPASTTGGPLCPDIVCPDMYVEFGKICGVNKYDEKKTFDNYCKLLDEDCIGRYNWFMAYRGKCDEEYIFQLFPVKYLHYTPRNHIISFYASTVDSTKYITFFTFDTMSTRPGQITTINWANQMG